LPDLKLTSTVNRALVVDDDAEILRNLVAFLEKIGITASPALDGIAALKIFEREKFDLVITDLRMPNMHGQALVREIFQRQADQLLIVTTGIDDPQLARDLFARGVRAILPKPFSFDMFAATVGGLLEHEANDRRRREMSVGAMRAQVAEQMKSAAKTLTSQLDTIQEHFKKTVRELEEQQMDLERDYLGSVRMMAELLDNVMASGSSHVTRVEDLSRRIGEALNLSPIEMRDLSLASLLHDIGKFSCPSG